MLDGTCKTLGCDGDAMRCRDRNRRGKGNRDTCGHGVCVVSVSSESSTDASRTQNVGVVRSGSGGRPNVRLHRWNRRVLTVVVSIDWSKVLMKDKSSLDAVTSSKYPRWGWEEFEGRGTAVTGSYQGKETSDFKEGQHERIRPKIGLGLGWAGGLVQVVRLSLLVRQASMFVSERSTDRAG